MNPNSTDDSNHRPKRRTTSLKLDLRKQPQDCAIRFIRKAEISIERLLTAVTIRDLKSYCRRRLQSLQLCSSVINREEGS
jgi:hypothetical protein